MFKKYPSQLSQSAYAQGKDLNLLPFELFHQVKAGRLRPVDNNGEPILNYDVQIKLDRQNQLEEELRVLPFRYGKLETGIMVGHPTLHHYDKELEKVKLDEERKVLLNELENIKKDLSDISDFYSWASVDLPKDKKKKQNIYDFLLRARYKTCETEDENNNSNAKLEIPKEEQEKTISTVVPVPIEKSAQKTVKETQGEDANNKKNQAAENCFKQNANFWTILFQGIESDPINHVTGMFYIARLLEQPGKSVSCSDLDLYAKKSLPHQSISLNEAISEGLHTDHQRQAINDSKADAAYWKEKMELEDEKMMLLDIDSSERTPEDNFRLKEIAQELNELQSLTKVYNFNDNRSKKQSLVIGNLKTAYRSIKKDEKMKDCLEHITKNIKPDGAFDYIYTGGINWKVIYK